LNARPKVSCDEKDEIEEEENVYVRNTALVIEALLFFFSSF